MLLHLFLFHMFVVLALPLFLLNSTQLVLYLLLNLYQLINCYFVLCSKMLFHHYFQSLLGLLFLFYFLLVHLLLVLLCLIRICSFALLLFRIYMVVCSLLLYFFVYFHFHLYFFHLYFFYLYFFVMIKRNNLYRTFLCLLTIWFLYYPGWSLLVHHWSVRLLSSLQRYTYFYKKRSLTLS